MQLLTDLRSALTWLESETTIIEGNMRADLHRILLDAHNWISAQQAPQLPKASATSAPAPALPTPEKAP